MAKGAYKTISTDDDEENSSFASLLLFTWMTGIFKTGAERALEQHDFLPLSESNSTCLLTEQLKTNWNQERTNCNTNGKNPSLWKSVVKLVSIKDVFVIVFTAGLFTVSRLLQPLFLGYLVSTLMAAESKQRYLLYACALAMCIIAFVGSLGVHQYDYRCEVLAIRISSALKGLVYFKVSIFNNYSTSAISRVWYNGSYTIAAKPIKTLELHYTMIQFLIMLNTHLVAETTTFMSLSKRAYHVFFFGNP